MKPQQKPNEFEIRDLPSVDTAEIVQLPKTQRQSDLLQPDESMSEFEWARVTSKTWDMEQG
ncbi:MAG: hypothetical protein CBB90_04190 [Gammaproteobacteria bacterium TMED30]|nr:MAG: hypothetical protein CBB90_04190 [Gammaproteobacteria bacterium TMED30]